MPIDSPLDNLAGIRSPFGRRVAQVPQAISATTSPQLDPLADGDTLSTAVTWGAGYESSAGTITGTVREVSVNGGAWGVYDGTATVSALDTYRLRETVSDSAGNSRAFFTGTQTVAGIAPSITASDSLTARTLTISVDTLSGNPAPSLALTTLTLDGVDVLADATGADPWTYTVPDSSAAQAVAWTVTATNAEGTATASGVTSVSANLFAPTASTAPTISGTVAPGETVTLNEGTYTGTTPITITFTLTLDGVDVTADVTSNSYTIPAGTDGQALVYTETASNGTAPDATQSVTETVQAGAEIISPTVGMKFPAPQNGLESFNVGAITENVSTGFALIVDFVKAAGQPEDIFGTVFGSDGIGGYPAVKDDKIGLSNLSAWTTGTTILTDGKRYQAAYLYDGSVLNAWVVDDAGVLSKEIDNVSLSFAKPVSETFIGKIENGLLFDGVLYDWIYWQTIPSESDLLSVVQRNVAVSSISTQPRFRVDFEFGMDRMDNVLFEKSLGVPEATQTFAAADTPSGDFPDNFVVMRDPDGGAPITYDAGAGAVYWALYIDRGTKEIRFATSVDLSSWTDNSLYLLNSGFPTREVDDFIYLGNETGSHDPFWIFTHDKVTGGHQMLLHTSSDMSTWTADANNPVFENVSFSGSAGPEDFRVVKVGPNDWAAFYEQDTVQDGRIAVGVAQNTNAVPSGVWTNRQNQAFSEDYPTIDRDGRFIANPAPIARNGKVYAFHEIAIFAPGGGKHSTGLQVSSDPYDPQSWAVYGIVAGSGVARFANCATYENGAITLYCKDRETTLSGIIKETFEPNLTRVPAI